MEHIDKVNMGLVTQHYLFSFQNPDMVHPKLQPIPIGNPLSAFSSFLVSLPRPGIMRRGHEDGSGDLELWEDLLRNELEREEDRERRVMLYINISPRNRDLGWDRMR